MTLPFIAASFLLASHYFSIQVTPGYSVISIIVIIIEMFVVA